MRSILAIVIVFGAGTTAFGQKTARASLPIEFSGYSLNSVVEDSDPCVAASYLGKNIPAGSKFSGVKCYTDSQSRVWAIKAHYSEAVRSGMTFEKLAKSLSKEFGGVPIFSLKEAECDGELSFAMLGSGKMRCAVWENSRVRTVLTEDFTDNSSKGEESYRYYAITTVDKELRKKHERAKRASAESDKRQKEQEAQKLLNSQ